MLNNQNIQNNWPQIKSQVLNKWKKLSEAEVEKTHGNPNSLERLVQSKYGSIKDFDRTYERICESMTPSSKNIAKTSQPFQSQADGFNDIENRDPRMPSSEAGMPWQTTESTFDDSMRLDSPEKRMKSNYSKIEHEANMNRETDDELSAYSSSRVSVGESADFSEDYEKGTEQNNDSEKANIKFTTPDEFYPSQDPTPSREDITLGRNTSSTTKISTAKAAPNSSAVSSNDAKRKL